MALLGPDTPPLSPVALARKQARGELTRDLLKAHRGMDLAVSEAKPLTEAQLVKAARGGAQWFYWIAALSLINSVSAAFGWHVSFLAGLAVSEIIDLLAKHLGSVGPYLALGLNLVIAFFVCGFGYLALHGSRMAFLTGTILYALDGLVFLHFSLYAPAAFHAFALLGMVIGWHAQGKLVRRQDTATPTKLTAV